MLSQRRSDWVCAALVPLSVQLAEAAAGEGELPPGAQPCLQRLGWALSQLRPLPPLPAPVAAYVARRLATAEAKQQPQQQPPQQQPRQQQPRQREQQRLESKAAVTPGQVVAGRRAQMLGQITQGGAPEQGGPAKASEDLGGDGRLPLLQALRVLQSKAGVQGQGAAA